MSGLDPSSPLLEIRILSGIHQDAVRCIYDERLNRAKSLYGHPTDQFNLFSAIIEDAGKFWCQIKDFPEDITGRRQTVSKTLGNFFDRVIRYSNFHSPEGLTDQEKRLQQEVISTAEAQKEVLVQES